MTPDKFLAFKGDTVCPLDCKGGDCAFFQRKEGREMEGGRK